MESVGQAFFHKPKNWFFSKFPFSKFLWMCSWPNTSDWAHGGLNTRAPKRLIVRHWQCIGNDLNCKSDVFTNDIMKASDCLILTNFFNLSDIDQNIYKQAIQIKTGIVLKNLSRETQNDRIFVHRGLRYAHKKLKFACKFFFGKCLFEYKIQFEVEKKTKKLLMQFQILLFFLIVWKFYD